MQTYLNQRKVLFKKATNMTQDPTFNHHQHMIFIIISIVETLVLCFMHSYCVIPRNIPFVIQRDVLVSGQFDRRHDSLQTYITAVGRCFL